MANQLLLVSGGSRLLLDSDLTDVLNLDEASSYSQLVLPDSRMEMPELYIPRQAPINGPVKIDRSHPRAKYVQYAMLHGRGIHGFESWPNVGSLPNPSYVANGRVFTGTTAAVAVPGLLYGITYRMVMRIHLLNTVVGNPAFWYLGSYTSSTDGTGTWIARNASNTLTFSHRRTTGIANSVSSTALTVGKSYIIGIASVYSGNLYATILEDDGVTQVWSGDTTGGTGGRHDSTTLTQFRCGRYGVGTYETAVEFCYFLPSSGIGSTPATLDDNTSLRPDPYQILIPA